MSENWGPHYIVPSEVLKKYSGSVLLREEFDEELLAKELKELGLTGSILRVVNPWYYRQKNMGTWIKIGESMDKQANFPVRWDTTALGLMHVFVRKNGDEVAIARENVVEVTVAN
jgi:hypothetical protein